MATSNCVEEGCGWMWGHVRNHRRLVSCGDADSFVVITKIPHGGDRNYALINIFSSQEIESWDYEITMRNFSCKGGKSVPDVPLLNSYCLWMLSFYHLQHDKVHFPFPDESTWPSTGQKHVLQQCSLDEQDFLHWLLACCLWWISPLMITCLCFTHLLTDTNTLHIYIAPFQRQNNVNNET